MSSKDFSFSWDWKDFCGDNFTIWNAKYKDLDVCFQYLCLDVPVLAILAIVSAYYYGLGHLDTRRCSKDKWILRFRYNITLALASLPAIQLYIEESMFPGILNPVDFLLGIVQCISWVVHFMFTFSMSYRHTKSLRGPVLLNVIWSTTYMLCFINVHSHFLIVQNSYGDSLSLSQIPYIFSIINIVLLSCYLVTLLPNGSPCPPITFGNLSLQAQVS